jgi:hypothetical protein
MVRCRKQPRATRPSPIAGREVEMVTIGAPSVEVINLKQMLLVPIFRKNAAD